MWDIAAELHRNYKSDFFINDLIKYNELPLDIYISKVKNIFSKNSY